MVRTSEYILAILSALSLALVHEAGHRVVFEMGAIHKVTALVTGFALVGTLINIVVRKGTDLDGGDFAIVGISTVATAAVHEALHYGNGYVDGYIGTLEESLIVVTVSLAIVAFIGVMINAKYYSQKESVMSI